MPESLKRKPRARPPKSLVKRKKFDDHKPTARTSTVTPPKSSRNNLTLADWLKVYAFVDQHPDVTQGDVVRHFANLESDALDFTQSTLSRKLRDRQKMESRVHDNPRALSSKRPRVVTSPEVERALVLWVQRMQHDGETVTGPMLLKKRRWFEEELGVAEEEKLTGDGWITSFRKTYNIGEYRRHGGNYKTSLLEETMTLEMRH